MQPKREWQLQWLDVKDERLDWLNVADWEPRGDGLQPVRVPKVWRDRWPARTARRGMSAAGVTVRFRTDSNKLVFRLTFVDVPDAPATPAVAWERSRPSFFSLYRDAKYVTSVAALTVVTQQDVTIFDDALAGEAELQVLLPFYYRNAEVIMPGAGHAATGIVPRRFDHPRPRRHQPARNLCLAGRGNCELRAAQLRLRRHRVGRQRRR